MTPLVQVNYLLRDNMALHAVDIEQLVLLGGFACGTLEAEDSLRGLGRLNRVSHLDCIASWISFEEEQIIRLARGDDTVPR